MSKIWPNGILSPPPSFSSLFLTFSSSSSMALRVMASPMSGFRDFGVSRKWGLQPHAHPPNLEGQNIYICPTPRSNPGCYGWPYQQLAAEAIVSSDTQYTSIMSTPNNVMTKTQILISVIKKLCESALWQSNVYWYLCSRLSGIKGTLKDSSRTVCQDNSELIYVPIC